MLNLSSCLKTAVLCLAALVCAGLTAQEDKDKTRIGVVFENRSKATDRKLSFSMGRLPIYELKQNKNYRLIDLSNLSSVKAAKEAGLNYIALVQAAKKEGLNYIVFGDVFAKVGHESKSTNIRIAIKVKVVETETGKVVLSENEQGSRTWADVNRITTDHYDKAAEKPMAKIAYKIMSDIHPLEPVVLLVREKELAIDVGSEAGIRKGQRFTIVREGENLYDKDGELIGVDIIEIAQVTIIRAEPNVAYAKIVKINKDPATNKPYVINLGDIARLNDRRTIGEKLKDYVKPRPF
jgi:hypothetical protein